MFQSYSWQGMGFVPASICCLEPFPVGRPDPGAPSTPRGAERHLRTETSATCAWLQGHSSASSGTCAFWKGSGIEKSLSNEIILSKCLGNSQWLCTAALPLLSNTTSIPMGFLWILWIFFSPKLGFPFPLQQHLVLISGGIKLNTSSEPYTILQISSEIFYCLVIKFSLFYRKIPLRVSFYQSLEVLSDRGDIQSFSIWAIFIGYSFKN